MHFSSTVDCADIHSLVAMPLCGLGHGKSTTDCQYCYPHRVLSFGGEAKAVPN